MTDILIIEDNAELGNLIADFMRREGWSVTLSGSAEEGLAFLEKETCKLLLLDIMLPGKDGFAALAEIRKTRNMPVMIMSAKSDDESKILGIEIGADDYVEKSVSIPVLTSKIRALMRRSYEVAEDKQILSYGELTVDIGARVVYKKGVQIELNGKEFDLLVYLMKHRGKALGKELIFNAIWGEASYSELSSLSVYISWLRDKIEDDPRNPKYIKTVYMIGYQFGEA